MILSLSLSHGDELRRWKREIIVANFSLLSSESNYVHLASNGSKNATAIAATKQLFFRKLKNEE